MVKHENLKKSMKITENARKSAKTNRKSRKTAKQLGISLEMFVLGENV